MHVNQNTREYVRFLAEEFAIDGVDIFCCDKSRGPGDIFEIYGYGMGGELKDGYRRSRLFEVDPFTDLSVRESLIDAPDSFELGSDPRLGAAGLRSERYWRFMAECDVEIVGASTRRFLPGFYLVIGLHRLKSKAHSTEIVYERLDQHLRALKDMVSADVLLHLIRAGDGYGALRRSWAEDEETADDPLASLSPRETEIARLICLGKQNKQVAYVTGLSVHTVENHLKRIYRKLRIQNRATLVSRIGERMLH